jgi:hypothetical protein
MRTIALRFRDFVTGRGQTLSEHSALIDSKGYAWWGWWKKPYENLPTQFLLELISRAPLDIYLLDTGGTKEGFHFYRSRLEDIAVTPTGTDIPSPDVSATPTYYNTWRFPAWFKLTDLELEPIRKPVSLKLVSLPTWPSPNDPDISRQLGLDINSQEQLRRLDVTLWHIEIEA